MPKNYQGYDISIYAMDENTAVKRAKQWTFIWFPFIQLSDKNRGDQL